MPENEHNEADDEQRAALKRKERELNYARNEGFLFGIVAVGYVWLVFNGLWGLVEELLRELLPPFFAVGYTVAIIVGIGGLMFWRGFMGESWFDQFHRGWKGRVFGLAFFAFIVTPTILIIWLATLGMSLWLTLSAIFIAIPIVFALGFWAFKRLANRIGVNF